MNAAVLQCDQPRLSWSPGAPYQPWYPHTSFPFSVVASTGVPPAYVGPVYGPMNDVSCV